MSKSPSISDGIDAMISVVEYEIDNFWSVESLNDEHAREMLCALNVGLAWLRERLTEEIDYEQTA